MARLIDAETYPCRSCGKEYCYQNCKEFRDWFENTVDAVEVVHGRWIELPSMAPEYKCSKCGQSYEWWEVSEAHYCPNCGAKMDLEER